MGSCTPCVLDILPNILLGSMYAVSAVPAPTNNGLHSSIASRLIEVSWAFDMILNVSVTGAIAVRLWWMGRKMASLTAIPANQYTSSIYLAVQSGAIFVATSILTIVLYASNRSASLTILDVASQLAVCDNPTFLPPTHTQSLRFCQALMPLLIIVQVGLTGRYHIPSSGASNTVLFTEDEVICRTGTLQEQDSRQDVSFRTDTVRPCSQSHHTCDV